MDVITTHVNADFDCLGAMVAARKLYPGAEMVFAGSQERSLREFLLRSTVYAFNFKRFRDIDAAAVSRLILVDVRQSERIGPFGEVARRPGVELHIFDHHPSGKADLHGALEVIEPVGSTVTVLTHLFIERNIVPTPEEATVMMLGLYEDTGNLLFSSTTRRDYQAAAFLHEHGANLNAVSDFLTQELTPDQVALLHELIRSRSVLNVNGIDISIAHASVDHFVGDLAMLAHKLKDMESLDALLVAVRMGDRIFLVGRSRLPEVHVGEILAEFGGGGHRFAASGTVRDLTLVEVLERFREVLHRLVNPRWEARHLMTAPVKSVSRRTPIKEVRQILTRYNINSLPVMEGPRVVGIITRQVAEKAAHHGLAEMAVNEVMTGEFAVAAPTTPVDTLQELIVERNQRFVPVIDKNRLVGAITRTDLLRHLVSGSRSTVMPPVLPAAEGRPGVKKREIMRLVRENLPSRVQKLLHDFGRVGDELGLGVFAVGGFVRDLLLGLENLDVDIVVEGDGIAFAEGFARRSDCRIRTHRKFGTAVIIFPDGFKVDVASTRMEYYLEPGALPKVEHASIKLDLYRRDFTVNTLALSLSSDSFGELLDFFGGVRDLQDRVLRVLHSLSFVEDPTRVFRAIRFEQRLGFRIGPQTEHLLRSAVQMGFLSKVGGLRVFNELKIIFQEADPLPAVFRMAELDLLKAIHPALGCNHRARPLFEAASRAIHWYELLYTGRPVERWLVYLLCLTDGLDHDAMEGVRRRLGIPARYEEVLLRQRDEGQRLLQQMERRRARGREPQPSEIYRWLSPFAVEILLYLMARAATERVRSWISLFCTRLRGTTPKLTGDDLRKLGIPAGPVYKEIIATLLDAQLNGKVETREDEIALVRKRYLGRTPESGSGRPG